jgi:hypothetical protein
MKALSYLVSFAIAVCGLMSIERPAAFAEASAPRASATSADVTGTWAVTIHYPLPDGDYLATYVLKQDGEKITGEYQGMYGPAAVTGSIKSDDVVLRVTVKRTNAEFMGKVSSTTKMSGTVTGTSDQPRKWSAEKKK